MDKTTVIEFCAKHCAEHGEATAKDISAHVNAIILAAILRNRALWEVGVDPDGRASLIWTSCPDLVWEHLLAEGVRAQAMIDVLGAL